MSAINASHETAPASARARWILKCTAAASIAAVLAIGLPACSQQQLVKFATGEGPHHPTYWVIDADTSGSTTSQTQPGGPYEQEIMAALAQGARDEATIYAAPVDGNTVADGTWTIDAAPLRTDAGGGNPRLAEVARTQSAERLRPRVRALLASRPTNGSDILGAFERVALLSRNLTPPGEKTLVLLTDGAINLSKYHGYDIYTEPPVTPALRHALIARFKRNGELPRLPGWNVYLGGIGVGIGNRATARATIALWAELVPAMGAHLAQMNSPIAFG